ncbi:hypothetical protein Tco_0856880, partial [Tanacetum coccineum]
MWGYELHLEELYHTSKKGQIVSQGLVWSLGTGSLVQEAGSSTQEHRGQKSKDYRSCPKKETCGSNVRGLRLLKILPKRGRNLQEESEGLEAAETLAKVLTQRTKTYTRKVKTGLRRKLDADEVSTGEGINTGFTDVNTAFEKLISVMKHNSISKSELEQFDNSKGIGWSQVQEAASTILKKIGIHGGLRVLTVDLRELERKLLKRDYLKKLKPDELKEEFDKCVEKVEKFIPVNSELEALKLKRTGINLQADVFKKQKITDVPDITKDESKNKSESARSDIEEDIEAYMDERVDEPSLEEFQMGSIPQGSTPAKIVKWEKVWDDMSKLPSCTWVLFWAGRKKFGKLDDALHLLALATTGKFKRYGGLRALLSREESARASLQQRLKELLPESGGQDGRSRSRLILQRSEGLQ